MKQTAMQWVLKEIKKKENEHFGNPEPVPPWVYHIIYDGIEREKKQREADIDAALTAYVFNTNTK